jgi:hypothetical protein
MLPTPWASSTGTLNPQISSLQNAVTPKFSTLVWRKSCVRTRTPLSRRHRLSQVAAASEFQKILDHRGIVTNFVLGALAHLQLGRAYAIERESAKAKSAYQDFFSLWKDADPDIPVLKQARAEYAKLQ